MMYRDRTVCRAVYEGVPPGTPVFGLAGTYQEEVAKELGLPFVAELYGASLTCSAPSLICYSLASHSPITPTSLGGQRQEEQDRRAQVGQNFR